MSKLTDRDRKLLLKLAEECSELAAEILKGVNKRWTVLSKAKVTQEVEDVKSRIEDISKIIK